MTTYSNRTTSEAVAAADRVFGRLFDLREEEWAPDQDELEELVHDAGGVLIWLRETATGIDPEGAPTTTQELIDALAVLDEQRETLQGLLWERLREN